MSSSQTSSSSSEPSASPEALASRLDRAAGSDFDVRVHGVPVAYGEVAVIDDGAALRITRLTAPSGVGWE